MAVSLSGGMPPAALWSIDQQKWRARTNAAVTGCSLWDTSMTRPTMSICALLRVAIVGAGPFYGRSVISSPHPRQSPGLAQANAGSRPRQWCGAKRNSAQGSAAGAFSQWHAGAGRGGDVAGSECLALDVAAMPGKARARALGVGGGVERLSRSPSQKPRSQACASMSMRVWRIDRVATSITGRRQWAQLRCLPASEGKATNRIVRVGEGPRAWH